MLSMQFSTTLRRCGRGPRLPVKLRRPMKLRRSATRLEASVTLVCSMRNASSCKRRWIRQRRQQAVIQTRRRWCRHSAADGGTRPTYPRLAGSRPPCLRRRHSPIRLTESPCPGKRLRERRKEESSSSPGCKADPGRALQPGLLVLGALPASPMTANFRMGMAYRVIAQAPCPTSGDFPHVTRVSWITDAVVDS